MTKLGPTPYLSRINPSHTYIDSSGWVRETLGYIHYASNNDVFAVGKLFRKLCKRLEPLRAAYSDIRIVIRDDYLAVHGYRDATADERKVIAERVGKERQRNITRATEALAELSQEDCRKVLAEVSSRANSAGNLEG